MAEPFSIRIYVPDGDPEGVRIIDRMGWTGLGLVFPRTKWADVVPRTELTRAGSTSWLVTKKEKTTFPQFTSVKPTA